MDNAQQMEMVRKGTYVTDMSMSQILVDESQGQQKFDERQMADWVNYLAPWEFMADLTFRDRILPETWARGRHLPAVVTGMPAEGARKRYEKFMRKELPQVSYFYAIEPNPSRDGSHVHALWADCGGTVIKCTRSGELLRAVSCPGGSVDAFHEWFVRFGRCKISRVRNQNDVTLYCGKHLASSYVTKGSVWWNVKLQWHRIQKMNNASFQLR